MNTEIRQELDGGSNLDEGYFSEEVTRERLMVAKRAVRSIWVVKQYHNIYSMLKPDDWRRKLVNQIIHRTHLSLLKMGFEQAADSFLEQVRKNGEG